MMQGRSMAASVTDISTDPYLTDCAFKAVSDNVPDAKGYAALYGKHEVIVSCKEEKEKRIVNPKNNVEFFKQISLLIDALIAWGKANKYDEAGAIKMLQQLKK